MNEVQDFRKNKQFWLLCISSTLFFSSFNMVIPELPSYLDSLGGGEYKGFIISLFTLTALISRPFSGKLTDTIGRIPVMVFGAIIGVFAGVMYPLLTSVAGFMMIRLFHGLSTGFKPTATSAYVADIVSESERGVSMGILGVFTSSGMAVGPMLGPWISSELGINTLFYISSLVSFLSVAVIFGMKETLSGKQKMTRNHLKIKPSDFFERNVLPVAITFLLTVIPFGIILTIIPDFSDSLGIKNRGVFFSVYVVASLLVRLVAGKISDKHGRIPVLILASFMLGTSMVLLSLTQNISWFYFSALLFGLASGMNSPTIFAWNIDRANPQHRGRAMATLYMFLEFGIGSGALLSGAIFNNNLDNIPIAFSVGAITAYSGTIYLIWFKSSKSKR